MPPTLYLVRHAEGEHNVNVSIYFEDPIPPFLLGFHTLHLVLSEPKEPTLFQQLFLPRPFSPPETDPPQRRHHLRDPHLTPLGHTQCAALRETFPDNDKVSIVMASPLKRTIQTASYCFGAALARPDVPFLLVPHAQEVAANPCDTGFAADELKAALPEMVDAKSVEFDLGKIDFGLVEEGWNSKVRFTIPFSFFCSLSLLFLLSDHMLSFQSPTSRE